MKRSVPLLFIFLLVAQHLKAQKIWEDDGVTIVKLDTLSDGFAALKGYFIIPNSSIYEVMNLILDVDGYDWVEGESTSKMLAVDPADSSFTFDFFVNIPWLFVKTTGRVHVEVTYADGVLSTQSTQIKDYHREEGYDEVDFYSAQWKVTMANQKDVAIEYFGVYKDVDMLIDLNGLIIGRIRKRLNATFHNLIERSANKPIPATALSWPRMEQ